MYQNGLKAIQSQEYTISYLQLKELHTLMYRPSDTIGSLFVAQGDAHGEQGLQHRPSSLRPISFSGQHTNLNNKSAEQMRKCK